MIDHPAFAIDPWQVREEHLHFDLLAQTESVFALCNGHIGMRGNLDEGEPHGLPGTYLNAFYELRPLPYGEAGFGYPEASETVINVTNGKLIRLLVDDEPFDVRYGALEGHQRVLDLRSGTLRRRVEWTSPTGVRLRVESERLVSLAQRAVAAIDYRVEILNRPATLVIQSELVANEELPAHGDDPRAAAAMEQALEPEECQCSDTRAILIHRTRRSGLRMGAAMDHVVEGSNHPEVATEEFPNLARTRVICRLEPGQSLRLVKYLAYGWSGRRSLPALHDQVVAALAAARFTGWEGLVSAQRQYLDDFWARADVEVEGDPEVQQAARFGLFHVLQAGARAEQRAIGAKGQTGSGYDGHAFWDTETFVLPVLTYTLPDAAADALRWRHRTLPLALQRAQQLGLEGAAFPWRTIAGQEGSSYWPAGTAAFHVNADIAAAVYHYVGATGDERFEREVGLELLVQTARLWRSLGHHDPAGRFRISGVTGPDEYSALADNNVYTNLMAQQNLWAAADAAARHPEAAKALGADAEEMASWRDAASNMFIPYDEERGVHPQAEGFTMHERWDFAETSPDQYPLMLHFHYFDLYRKQVVKQADLVLAMQRRADAFTPEQKARNFRYYEEITVRDSSLSSQTQAVLAAEVGHLDLAYDYLRETALIDLHDLQNNTRDGLHIAALAGAWAALVTGFGGLRCIDNSPHFAPRLPDALERLVFNFIFRGCHLRVTVNHDEAAYELMEGPQVELSHHGQRFVVSRAAPVVKKPIPPAPKLEAPRQPPGRELRSRRTMESGSTEAASRA
ncbi:MAG: glycoside hydrolase family 65 protein [Acidimicrobiales bacterium]|nr:glycoside hydrolase family 65 protein [Acidimicrobiales bacterium]MBO0886238.1 glycoside hydrolase family 65 protein [Acidimicrobiales bacterium]